MQYMLLPDKNNHFFLADCKEFIALNEGVTDTPQQADTLRLVYGVYKPQPNHQYERSEIQQHVNEAVGQWLIHIDNKTIVNIHLEALVISQSEQTQEVPFAALLRTPSSFVIDNQSHRAYSAYVRADGEDPISTLIHRKGLFAFVSEESVNEDVRLNYPLTHNNWRKQVNHLRLLREAKGVQ